MMKLSGTYYMTQETPENAVISTANLIGQPYPHPLNKVGDKEYWSNMDVTYVVDRPSKYSFIVQVFKSI